MSGPGRRWWAWGLATVLGAGVIALQIHPYGRAHTNPPVIREPPWDSPATRALAVRACFDCHSNQTRWPWYSHVAPFSWLVQRDVDQARRALNFSEFHRRQRNADEAAEMLSEGLMPPRNYLRMHRAARLSPEEKQRLVQGFTTTMEALPMAN